MEVNQPEKRFAVVDKHGAGWGRYATGQEADERAASLNAMNPDEEFEVFERHRPTWFPSPPGKDEP